MNTSKTYLYYKATGSETEYVKLVDVTSFPDPYTAPGKIDVTTLSDTQHVYIPDIADTADMVFGCIYTKTDMTKIKALEGKQTQFELRFGETGEEGKFQWTGDIFFAPKGGSVGEARLAEITIYPSTAIVEATV